MKRRRRIAAGLSIALIWVLFMQFFGTPWPWKLWTVKQELRIHLEEKYGEPFTVGVPRFALIGGDYHAKASPKRRPEVTFYVGEYQGEDGIQDGYLRKLEEYERER